MLKKLNNIFDGYFLHHSKDAIPAHIQEQALYRAFLCKPCVDRGYCDLCGCRSPHLFLAPNKTDARNKWSKMVSHSDWEEFKKTPTYGQYIKSTMPPQTSGITPGTTTENSLRSSTSTETDSLDKETTLPPISSRTRRELPNKG